MSIDDQIKAMINSWGKYHNPKELEKDVKHLFNSVVRRVRNKFEFTLNEQLKRSKVQFGYEATKLPYTLHGSYLPDWTIYTDESRTKIKFVIEAKGYFRPESKRKLVAAKLANPKVEIKIVFYRRLEKNIKWAERHGFKYAIGKIPEEWLK